MSDKLSHFDKNGNAVMVDVSDKPITHRTAIATGSIQVGEENKKERVFLKKGGPKKKAVLFRAGRS